MTTLRAFKPAVLALAMAALSQTTLAAPIVVDQSQTASNVTLGLFGNLYGWDRQVSIWQSFTAGTTGTLAGVGMTWGGTIASADLKIYAGTGVTGTLLSSYTLSNVVGTGTLQALTTGMSLAQTAGSVYTFSLENLVCAGGVWGCYYSASHNTDAYAAGVFMGQGYHMPDTYRAGVTNADLVFQTLVQAQQQVPEPSALALVGLTLAGLGVASRRRQA
jgi:PEP-CTERM motif